MRIRANVTHDHVRAYSWETGSVEDRCTCGAVPPPDALFCHKCGKPQREDLIPEAQAAGSAPVQTPPVPAAMEPASISLRNAAAVRVAFLAAGIVTVLYTLPLGPVAAKLLIGCIAGGFLAVYLYSRRTGEILTVRRGARVGWLTGIFTFIIMTVLTTATVALIFGQGGIPPDYQDEFRRQYGPEMARQLEQLSEHPAYILVGLGMFFPIFTLLSVLGGALCAKVLEKD